MQIASHRFRWKLVLMALALALLMRKNLKMQSKILHSYSITGESKLFVHDQYTDVKNTDSDLVRMLLCH